MDNIPQIPESSTHMVRNILVILGIIIALMAASFGVFYYFNMKSQELPVSVQPALEKQEMLAFDSVKILSFSNEELLDRALISARIFNEARATDIGLTFFDTNISLKELLAALSYSIPADFYRSLSSDKDFFGGVESGNFFIITSDSYTQAYAGMLEWEKTMNGDLFSFFSIPATETIVRFEDKIVGNKDARLATNKAGNTLFLYAFYDSETLIIAKNEEVLRLVQDMLLRKNL